MISSLTITNYALIRSLELRPEPGLNIITGETGAGKSIMLGALSLLRGARADARVVTDPAAKSVVEAVFALDPTSAAAIAPILLDADIDMNSEACIIRREVSPSGRSRAFINDIPTTLAVLEAVADHLVDIHSQHKNLLLARGDFQLQVLDRLADNAALLADYHRAYSEYRQSLHRYTSTRDAIAAARADADFIQYQFEQIDALNLLANEDSDLEARRAELSADAALTDNILAASDALTGDNSAVELAERAIDALTDLAQANDLYEPLLRRLESANVEIRDIAETLERQAADCRSNPEEIDDIDRRLSQINSLKARHHCDSVNDLIALRQDLADRLILVADGDTVLHQREMEARRLKRAAMAVATELSTRRIAAAQALQQELRSRAVPLGLPNLVCDLAVDTGKLNADGIDTVDFRFAFNKNQTPLPIGQTASGGEISRVMLALKSILAERVCLPTIIFDEIDTGVSGDVARRMGRLMAQIGGQMQVIAITHLPQVAACGQAHFKVAKRDDELSTATFVQRLSDDERRHELALMVSGDPNDAAALATADSLLNQQL